MSNFPQGSYVTVYFMDGTHVDIKFVDHNDFFLIGNNNAGNTVLVPFHNVKYIVK